MKRAVLTFVAGLVVGLAIPLTWGVEIAAPLFALGSRFAAASSPVYSVSVGSAFDTRGGPDLPVAKVRR